MNKKSWLSFSMATMALAGFLSACSHGERPETAEWRSLPTAEVRVQEAAAGQHLATEEVVGTIRARVRAVIEAKVSGRIAEMPVGAGQNVAAGELLARLEAREIQAKLDQALALRRQAEGDLERFTNLLAQEAVTRAEFDAVQARFQVAKAAVEEAETVLDYTKITAPFDGVVARKYVEVGDQATPGKPLLSLEDVQHLQLETNVPEALADRLALQDRCEVRIAPLDQPIEGTVVEMAPSADPNSRTFLVKLDLPAKTGLRPGQFGRVSVPLREESALRVPARSLVQRGQMEIIFVAVEGKARLRLVKTGKRLGDEVELVSGVEPGERVVTEGANALMDGQPLQIKP